MKCKLSWIPFIPVVFAAVCLRVYQVLFVDSGVDKGFLNSGAISLIFVGSIALLFIILAVLSFADKKTSPDYQIGRNFFAGFFGSLSGILLLLDSAMLFVSIPSASNAFATGANAVFTVIGGIMIFIMGISSLTGRNFTKKVPFLMLFPSVWCCARLIVTFLTYTTISVASKDMSDLVYMVFTTLFIFNASMVYINISGKNAVKACFLYGLPAVAVIFAYAGALISSLIHSGQTVDFFSNIQMFEFIALALYMIFFLVELTARAKEKGAGPAEETAVPVLAAADEAMPFAQENTRQSLQTGVVDDESKQAQRIMDEVNASEKADESLDYVGYYDRKEADEKMQRETGRSDYESTLDDIDRLILEISSRDTKE